MQIKCQNKSRRVIWDCCEDVASWYLVNFVSIIIDVFSFLFMFITFLNKTCLSWNRCRNVPEYIGGDLCSDSLLKTVSINTIRYEWINVTDAQLLYFFYFTTWSLNNSAQRLLEKEREIYVLRTAPYVPAQSWRNTHRDVGNDVAQGVV